MEQIQTNYGLLTLSDTVRNKLGEAAIKRHALKKTGKTRRGGMIVTFSDVDRAVSRALKAKKRELAKAERALAWNLTMLGATEPVVVFSNRGRKDARAPKPRAYYPYSGAPVNMIRLLPPRGGRRGVFSRVYQDRSIYVPHEARYV